MLVVRSVIFVFRALSWGLIRGPNPYALIEYLRPFLARTSLTTLVPILMVARPTQTGHCDCFQVPTEVAHGRPVRDSTASDVHVRSSSRSRLFPARFVLTRIRVPPVQDESVSDVSDLG